MLVLVCPHCEKYVEILELNCKIFRHGIYKKDYAQINPHLPKNICDFLTDNELIYGCGKPFMIVDDKPFICDYI